MQLACNGGASDASNTHTHTHTHTFTLTHFTYQKIDKSRNNIYNNNNTVWTVHSKLWRQKRLPGKKTLRENWKSMKHWALLTTTMRKEKKSEDEKKIVIVK